MLNVEVLLPLERVSETVLLIELHTPAAPSTDHTMKTDTTVTTPKAIARRKDTFITDHGSMRLSRSRARRGPRADAGGVRRAGCGSRTGATTGDWVWIAWVWVAAAACRCAASRFAASRSAVSRSAAWRSAAIRAVSSA